MWWIFIHTKSAWKLELNWNRKKTTTRNKKRTTTKRNWIINQYMWHSGTNASNCDDEARKWRKNQYQLLQIQYYKCNYTCVRSVCLFSAIQFLWQKVCASVVYFFWCFFSTFDDIFKILCFVPRQRNVSETSQLRVTLRLVVPLIIPWALV